MDICLNWEISFLTWGNIFTSRATCFFTRTIDEKWIRVNYVGIVIKRGDVETAIAVEA